MINTILLSKKELRKFALDKRKSLAQDGSILKKSRLIVDKIVNSLEFKKAKNIALYVPIKNEIDLTPLLKIEDKNFFLPRCNGENLEFVKYFDKNSLKIGAFNILEPQGDKINPEILDIIYIPALMANEKNYRLGYGKGFYDRFFRNNTIKAIKNIVLSKEFITNDFVQEGFDIPCDKLICEV